MLGKAYNLLRIPFLSFCLLSSWAILILHKNLCGEGGVTVSVDFGLWCVTGRLHFLLHVVRIICALSTLLDLSGELKLRIQTAVSRNKRRFLDPVRGFDLDLTYICDRLVAMSLPCTKGAIHRNEIREVSRFFATRHYSRFLIFNLCEDHEENGNGLYHHDFFFGQVSCPTGPNLPDFLPMNPQYAFWILPPPPPSQVTAVNGCSCPVIRRCAGYRIAITTSRGSRS